MRPSTLLHLYVRRLRTHPVQELMACFGIALGVALVFAVMVANSSIAGSATEIVRGINGTANLQLAARDSQGFDERLVERVRALAGVERAATVLEHRAVIVGDGKRIPIRVVSIDPSLASLAGPLAGNFSAGVLLLRSAVLLPGKLAQDLGVPTIAAQLAGGTSRPRVRMEIRGRSLPVKVGAVLGEETIGPLTEARVALAPLPYAQQLAGLPGRVTRILIDTAPGQTGEVRRGLAGLAGGGRLAITPADTEADLLEQAVRSNDQATGFFAAVSALVGLLLAFNAMLLTAPERRREIAELRILGYRPAQLVKVVAFQALVLGLVASLLGLATGSLLAHSIFQQTPVYLTPAFSLSTRTVVGIQPLVLAFAGGLLVSLLAAAPPLLDLRRSRAIDAVRYEGGEPGHALSPRAQRIMLAISIALLGLATALVLFAPSPGIVGTIALAFAAVLAIPFVFSKLVSWAEATARRLPRAPLLFLAALSLRSTTLRSLALATTTALAVFGSVAIGGARHDLLRGIERFVDQYVETADLWVMNAADDQATKDFPHADLVERLSAVPGVEDVRTYQGSFLDFGGRRVWIGARPRNDTAMLPAADVIDGDPARATAQLRRSGWITVSKQIADERSLDIGDPLTLPTPSGPARFRVAATTTNFGWPPGAIILNTRDYRRAWRMTDPTALEIDVQPGASIEAVQDAAAAALGPDTALQIQTQAERAAQINGNAQQGLQRLSQISWLVLVAAALAMASAMAAALWQRRASLATRRLQSFRPAQLWRMLMLEAGIVVAAGCLTGGLTGIYGQGLMDRYLRLETGFPAPFTPAAWQTIEVLLLVIGVALPALALPAYVASRVPPQLALQE